MLDEVMGAQVAEVALRPIDDSDLDALFEQRRDPESVRMAAFVAEDPDDRATFDVHMAKVRTSPGVTTRAVPVDGRLVGSIASFVVDGDTEVTYWIDRSFWGQGIASRALALLLESVRVRPLFARAASDNAGSLTVLQRAGFEVVGTEISYANGRKAEIEETILRLDGPAKSAPRGAPGVPTVTREVTDAGAAHARP
ncbi:GNAT family N-acetyltransferase [Micromonospora costi]|uniref:GNAT family N-acetyltransferase n=1 Tax=Micromonospora costi TaxID=1530042 RepID=UPI003406802F